MFLFDFDWIYFLIIVTFYDEFSYYNSSDDDQNKKWFEHFVYPYNDPTVADLERQAELKRQAAAPKDLHARKSVESKITKHYNEHLAFFVSYPSSAEIAEHEKINEKRKAQEEKQAYIRHHAWE
jgi:hypothetical protein